MSEELPAIDPVILGFDGFDDGALLRAGEVADALADGFGALHGAHGLQRLAADLVELIRAETILREHQIGGLRVIGAQLEDDPDDALAAAELAVKAIHDELPAAPGAEVVFAVEAPIGREIRRRVRERGTLDSAGSDLN